MNELMETELREEVTAVEQWAAGVVIDSQDAYQLAGEGLKKVKATSKKVEEYWEPMRKSTYDAYKAVNDHKAQMLTPLKNAEKTVKSKISGYLAEEERKRAEEEAMARAKAQEEAEKKIAEAQDAEMEGDFEKAEMAFAEAEVMKSASEFITIQTQEPAVTGISKRKDWEIVEIDPTRVPIDVAGVELRPVDEKAVLALIKATKGKVTIPGITYREKYTVAVRA